MGVYVKDMKMPEDCRECEMQVYYSFLGRTWCKSANIILADNYKPIPFDGRPTWCPLVEVPEPHGRLIDADKLFRDIEWDDIENAQTVIEAEGE